MIDSLSELLLQPGIKRAMGIPLVAKNLDQFKVFLGSFICGTVNRFTYRLQSFFSLKTLILINFIPIAYFAGKASAVSLSDWIDVILNAHVWFRATILVNIVYLFGRFLKDICTVAFKVVAVILAVWMIYKIGTWIYERIKEKFILKEV